MRNVGRFSLIFVLLFSFLIVGVFAGGQQEGAGGSADEEIVIGFSNAVMGDSWRQFLVANFEAECAAHEEITDYFITNADEKPEKQLSDIDDLLVKGVDALIVYPTVADAIIPAIERVHESDVPVIVFGGTIDTKSYTSLVMQDLKEMGRAQAEWLAEELGGSGKIVMLSGIAGNTTAEDRLAGAQEALSEYPDIEVLDHQYCDWSPPKAKSIMEAMLQAFPEIDGIWADSGLMSWPALQAMKEAGRTLVPSTGDQLNGYAKFLVDNNVRGYVYPMTTKLSGAAVRQALKAAKGEDVENVVYIDVEGYGPDEIEELVKPNRSDWWWIGDDQMPKEFLPEL
ncbi:MAG: ABC transporter substrate-binding protein [Spirochaetales bacterium]|nr:ABC transporter substrate-binding protein [Spirochaetales bacterium]